MFSSNALCVWLSTLSTASGLLTSSIATRRGGFVSMQYDYGQQQGAYAQNDPWAIPQQQDMGGQQAGGFTAQWQINAFNGVGPMPQTSFPKLYKYHQLPYHVTNGEDQVLGRCNMMFKTDMVDRVQCMVKIYRDGSPVIIGCGNKAPTLHRSRNGQWMPLYKGERRVLSDGDQVGLDVHDPEGAVFTCTDLAAGGGAGQQQQGGYGQQQQGGAGGLPFGWVQASDPASGQTYYYNEQTGQSSWECPQQ